VPEHDDGRMNTRGCGVRPLCITAHKHAPKNDPN
jgi:hypothetical protein